MARLVVVTMVVSFILMQFCNGVELDLLIKSKLSQADQVRACAARISCAFQSESAEGDAILPPTRYMIEVTNSQECETKEAADAACKREGETVYPSQMGYISTYTALPRRVHNGDHWTVTYCWSCPATAP